MVKTPGHADQIPFFCRHAAGLVCLAALLLGQSLGAQPGAPREKGESRQAVLERIQRECLRAYPADLLAEMASGAEEIPAEVEEAPGEQMHFLSEDLFLDKGIFYPTMLEEMLPAFQRYVTPGVRFLDLGSGDGRVLFLANVLGAFAVGIEWEAELVEVSRRAAQALSELIDPERLRIVQGDFFESPWSGYDVIFYFDMSSFDQERVRDKLEREMDAGARLIVGHEMAPFPGLELDTRLPDITVYRRRPESPQDLRRR